MKGIIGVLIAVTLGLAWLAWAGWTRTCPDTCPAPTEQTVATVQTHDAPPPLHAARPETRPTIIAAPQVAEPSRRALPPEDDGGPLVRMSETDDGRPLLSILHTDLLIDDARYSAFFHELNMYATPGLVETRFKYHDLFVAKTGSEVHGALPGDVACAPAYCITTITAPDEEALYRYASSMFGAPAERNIPLSSFILVPVPREHGFEARIVFVIDEDVRAMQMAGGTAHVVPVGGPPHTMVRP